MPGADINPMKLRQVKSGISGDTVILMLASALAGAVTVPAGEKR